ncbi:hypothetical protein JJJ17_07870 [Paracoccus caeni]|uniref:Uncharacterized protein n=1 Tax=Paracoccus caeni TaxID=657651 RepID=A0A934W002_9RHOB|nr:hypothetical protein [Paracoccus caeni]MBK4215838.1 hypothetical protein [Paracoccus caeni]
MDAETAAELLPLELQKPEWRKSPGTSLGDHVEERLEERALLDANPVANWPGRGRLHGLKYPERSETLAARTVEIFESVRQALKMKRGE